MTPGAEFRLPRWRMMPTRTLPLWACAVIHDGVRRPVKGMLICMRTTINLPDALAAEAKARAAAERRTFTSLVEEGLRSVLASDERHRGHPAEPLPAFGNPDDRALADLADRDAVWAALEAQ